MIPPSTTITDRGRRTRRVLLWLLGGFVALNLIAWGLTRLSSGGGVAGPAGSSYVTTGNGSAALEGLLRRLGVVTQRLRLPLDEVPLDASGTVVMIDVAGTEFTPSELNALDRFLRDGGRLVLAGQADFVTRMFPDPPQWRSAGASEGALEGEAIGDVDGTMRLSGFGSLEITDEDTPFLAAGDRVIGTTRPVGEGVFVWLADSHPLHNRGIGVGQASVVAVGMIDPAGPVAFDEYRHGYRDEAGVWDVIPTRWRTALLLGGIVTLLALVAYGRRFGPPYDTERRMAPGREGYLDAVSGILGRARARSEAIAVIREEILRRLEERGGGDDARQTARAMGLDEAQLKAVFEDEATDEVLVAADGALAALEQEKPPTRQVSTRRSIT